MENTDLKYLKKHYGEKFAHLCRELFPTILEHEGVLSQIISNNFAPTRSLYEDVLPVKEEFRDFVNAQVDFDEIKEQKEVTKTPEELLDEAGYILYPECQSEEEVQSFKKYWKEGEELCTFRGGRLENCRVWFAVKKNVDQIKRENFNNPKRQDEYGTSVISIQFTRGNSSTLSIKNRYNHTVDCPDATFSNNLDNIIPGLTQSFVKTYGINLIKEDRTNFYLDNYARGDDGRFYRINVEEFGVSFCENNKILHFGQVIELDKARYILADNYIIDKQEKTIRRFREHDDDAFIASVGEIKDITVKTDEEGNRVVVCTPKEGEDVEITLNPRNEIIGYKNPNVTEIGNGFLHYNTLLQKLELPNVKVIDDNFLTRNKDMKRISLPNVESIGVFMFGSNQNISEVDMPKLKSADSGFLGRNLKLKKISLPSLESAGNDFLEMNRIIEEVNLPRLTKSQGLFFS